MPLKGKAKTDYQREYMRRRRGSNPVKGLTDYTQGLTGVRPKLVFSHKLGKVKELTYERDDYAQ